MEVAYRRLPWLTGSYHPRFNYPERNCCACGKGHAQPPAPPPPPPPPAPPPPFMVGGGVLCGGACSDGMVLERANATVWGVGAKPGTKITATLKVKFTGLTQNSRVDPAV